MAEKTEFLQAFDDAILDANSLERFINGSDSETVLTRLSAEYPTLQKALKELFGNNGIAERFKTLTDLQASSLEDGAYALVADDADDNNGVYIKEGGAWIKSRYDLASISNLQVKKYIESALIFPLGEVSGSLLQGMYLAENPDSTVAYAESAANQGYSSIYLVEANTNYTIKKEMSSRFRVAEFDRYPYAGLKATKVHLYSADTPTANVGIDGVETQEVSFETSSVAKYVVAYISHNSDVPKVSLREGGSFELSEVDIQFRKDIVFGDAKLSDVSKLNDKIKRGKNLFKKDDYLEGNIVLTKSATPMGWINTSDTAANAKTAVLKIEPNTTYTISKSASDRFRVGLCDVLPTLNTNNIEVIAWRENDNSSEFTFTSGSTSNYLVLQSSWGTPEPDEVQVELGDEATEYESFGYKLFPEAKSTGTKSSAYDYAGAGNANYISKASATAGAWKDAQYTIPATDDTDTLQELFDSAKGVVSLESGKKYKITRPIQYNPEKVKLLKGNMAHIVCIGDIEAFQMVGTLTTSANAGSLNRRLAYNEMSPMVVALKITNPLETLGTAFVVSNVMSPIFLACNFSFLRRGIVFRGKNRNAILNSNHIYACFDYGIHFEEGGDIHQINIVGNHISYCRKNIFSENHSIYNIQITGNDIETSSYPHVGIGATAECCIHFLQTEAPLEDLEIVGNTIEDHFNTNVMIKIEGNPTSTVLVSCVTISGNVTGNSAGTVIEIGGASGVEILGQFKANYGYVVDVIGNIEGFKLSTQSRQNGGGLFRAIGNYTMKEVSICGNNLSHSVVQNPILVDVRTMNTCDFSGNVLRVTETNEFDDTFTAPISIHGATANLVRVDNNTINNISANTKAIEVVARSGSIKGSMRGNMVNYGSFTAPESFDIRDNI